jgi:hypothetical protein
MKWHAIVSIVHVLFVLVEISAEDILERPKEPLEAVSVHRHYSHVSLSDDIRSSLLVLQQSDFTEVVSSLVFVHLHGLSAS